MKYAQFLLLLLAAGCSQQLMPSPNIYVGSKKDCFDNVAQCYQCNDVDVLYVTDRAPLESPIDNRHYGTARSDTLVYGLCTVSIGKDLKWPDLVNDSRTASRRHDLSLACPKIQELGHMPKTPFGLVSVNGAWVDDPAAVAEAVSTRDAFWKLLADRVAKTPDKREAYVFIHGFNNSMEYAAGVMAELWHFMGRQGVPIIYTWPAGESYAYDRESGEFTLFHLKQFLRCLGACPSIDKVHIIAHSRGTDVTLSALRELNIEFKCSSEAGGARLKLGNVVLAAADLDIQVVRQRIVAERLPLMPERMTVYCSPTDKAIGAAQWLFKSNRRLGDLEPQDLTPMMRERLADVAQLQIIQARVKSNMLGHDYFHSNPAVSSDMILMLRDNRAPGAATGRPLKELFQNFWEIDDKYMLAAKQTGDQRTSVAPSGLPGVAESR